MRKTFIVLILALFAASCTSNAQQNMKRYKVKSGIVKYTTSISGKMMGSSVKGKGTEILYFKSYGAVELQEEKYEQTTVTNMFGQQSNDTEKVHTITKLDKDNSYSVDFDEQIIYKQKNVAMTTALYANADTEEAGKEIFESLGGKKIGNESIVGYNCEIWMLAGVKQWIYKGVMLKSEASVMGITTITTAESAQFNVSVDDRYFDLPDFPVKNQGDVNGMHISQSEMDEAAAELNMMSNMTFEQWKKIVQANDDEMKHKSDKELRNIYNMIQKMAKMSQ
jgi:hypothetical protein